ncbi:MAG TPA: anaerobic ribonucleoside-triphosphate reductase activating protein [Candidatus Adamsella sp.]|nr:anaerobic ribonucleoside-triphosphate reductase activating protein [Candidatus Adamsella sp.]
MNYHNITKDDMLNGDGLRVVLWVAGCTHHCKNCQNQITWDVAGGLPFDKEAEDELFEALDKPYISGITFSGGDPLHFLNRDEVFRLVKKCREMFPEKTIWIYTGYSWDDVKDCKGLELADVLVDGEFEEALKDNNLHWVGSSNQKIIDIKQSLKTGEIVLYHTTSYQEA